MSTKLNYLLPTLMLLGFLSACATPKVSLQPVAVQCQKPVVDSQLLTPARRQAQTSLDSWLLSLPNYVPSAAPIVTN